MVKSVDPAATGVLASSITHQLSDLGQVTYLSVFQFLICKMGMR